VHIKVNHEKHFCSLDPDEYTYILPYGTTIYELKQKLLYDEFEKFGWESDELILFEKACPCVDYDDDYELNDDYIFELQLTPDGAIVLITILTTTTTTKATANNFILRI